MRLSKTQQAAYDRVVEQGGVYVANPRVITYTFRKTLDRLVELGVLTKTTRVGFMEGTVLYEAVKTADPVKE